jgi:Co/Zn/Cd efflux system component
VSPEDPAQRAYQNRLEKLRTPSKTYVYSESQLVAALEGIGLIVDAQARYAEAMAVLKAFYPVMPGVETMGVMGGLALAANLVYCVLLYRSRGDTLNMRSTWFCSRNDVMANGGVLLAAAGCYVWMSRWPDLLVGAVIASLFLSSALHVLQQSMQALRAPLATVQHSVEWMTTERPHAKPSQTLLGQPHTGGTAGWHTPRRPSGWER